MRKKRRQFLPNEKLVELVPNSEGTQRHAYIRIKDDAGDFVTAIDRKPAIRRLRDWCNWMLNE